jgi:anti-sigma factor RsiW
MMEASMDDARDISESELAALADGSLAPARREALLRRVEASADLAAALATQRAALAAVRTTAAEPAPDALRATVASMVARAGAPAPARERRRRRLAFRLPLPLPLAGAGAAAALLAALVLVFTGGEAAPSVAQAAQVALAPASAPAPKESETTGSLDASVDGVAYPDWDDLAGWRATGARHDRLHGRAITTVFYADPAGQRVGYAIAAGDALPVSGGDIVERNGVRMRLLRSGPTLIVTWLRGGHTCILAARGVDAQELFKLASGDY